MLACAGPQYWYELSDDEEESARLMRVEVLSPGAPPPSMRGAQVCPQSIRLYTSALFTWTHDKSFDHVCRLATLPCVALLLTAGVNFPSLCVSPYYSPCRVPLTICCEQASVPAWPVRTQQQQQSAAVVHIDTESSDNEPQPGDDDARWAGGRDEAYEEDEAEHESTEPDSSAEGSPDGARCPHPSSALRSLSVSTPVALALRQYVQSLVNSPFSVNTTGVTVSEYSSSLISASE